MDLKTNVEQELWDIIEKNYENESFSSAILDAMHLLTDTIRNKTGLEGDGTSLVGQAFGGDNPKIQLNKLQTESEKNIQKGIQDILRGLYTAIRNPRSHDKYIDTKEDADSIIYFISYLLKIIDKSKLSFEESNFLNRVFDEHYVNSKEYSDLLVKEIPKRQRVNIAISVILKREDDYTYSLKSFISSLFDQFEDSEIAQVYKVISDELKYTSSEADIRTILNICPGKYWCKVDKVVKIRIENMLLESVKSGKFDEESGRCRFGSLGTWIKAEHLLAFEDISTWTSIIIRKFKYGDVDEKNYIQLYFWEKICRLNRDNIDDNLKEYFIDGLKNNDEKIVEKLAFEIQLCKDHPWWQVFEEELKKYPEIIYLDYDLPF